MQQYATGARRLRWRFRRHLLQMTCLQWALATVPVLAALALVPGQRVLVQVQRVLARAGERRRRCRRRLLQWHYCA